MHSLEMAAEIGDIEDTADGALDGAIPRRALRAVRRCDAIDEHGARAAVRSLLVALGQDADAEHLARTPERVAAAYAEMLTPPEFEMTTFANDGQYHELVLARDI